MLRWIASLAAAATLSGCVYTQEVVYRERYSPAPGYEQPYQSSYQNAPQYYSDDGYYYSPANGGNGDYYGANTAGTWTMSYGANYFDYPYYYSVFWPLNRWYYDPFAYPSYYYGVTFFPSSYLSLSLGYSGHWHGSSWLAYSPYRNSWVDNYYDWGRWYQHYPHYRRYYPTPRYGDAHVEASRLADMRRPARNTWGNRYEQNPRMRDGANAPAYRGNRGADYDRAGVSPRQGSMYKGPREDVRRVNAGAPRVEPSTGAFGLPTRANGGSRVDNPRAVGIGGQSMPRGDNSEVRRLSSQRDLTPRYSGDTSSSLLERQRADQRGYALPSRPPALRSAPSREIAPQQHYDTPTSSRNFEPGSTMPERGFGQTRELPRQTMPERERVERVERVERYPSTPRNLPSAPVNRGYSTDSPRFQAPPSSYQAPERQSIPRNEPVFQRDEPARQSPPSSYSSSRSSDDGDSSSSRSEVRRVGSSRER